MSRSWCSVLPWARWGGNLHTQVWRGDQDGARECPKDALPPQMPFTLGGEGIIKKTFLSQAADRRCSLQRCRAGSPFAPEGKRLTRGWEFLP